MSSRKASAVVLLVAALGAGASACGRAPDSGPETQRPTHGLDQGQVMIRVHLGGDEIPSPTRIENTTDPDICGVSHSLEDLSVDRETRGIRDVFVSLDPGPLAAEASMETVNEISLELANQGCRFEPHAAAVTVGTILETTNRDSVLHTVHIYGPREINLALPLEGSSAEYRLTEPGLYVIKCDVHGWMQAFVRVDEHPYHGVTDGAGALLITGIPAGDYPLEAWHERLGGQEMRVQVRSGETTEIEIEYGSL